jgi:hypothetical protein
MLALIIFFLFGYTGFYYLSSYYIDLQISTLLIRFILFFGSIFVIGILSVSYKLIELLTKKTMELSQANGKLAEDSETPTREEEGLEKTQTLLKEKDIES